MKKSVLISLGFYCVSVLLVVSILGIVLYAYCPRPEIKKFTTYSSAVFDNKDRLLRMTLSEDDRYRMYTTLDQVSPEFLAATILYEDQHFYHNSGVDYPALLRAFWETYVQGDRRIGASTITMQVARLRWNIASNTIIGKIKQIFRAIELSRHYSKNEILEAYINLVPYGRNIEGIAAASLIYFNKPAKNLNLPESLTLAVIPQNPNKRNPTTAMGYKQLLFAREHLFYRWLENNPEGSTKQKYLDMPLNIRTPESLPFLAPHFTDYVINTLPRWHSGTIKTSINIDQQKTLEKLMHDYVSSKSAEGINNAAALLVNYETMNIKAMVGSVDFFNTEIQGQVNGVLAKRSPGSTLKPFVYALAIDEGLIHPMTLMKDSPRRFGGFTPENHDKQFMGPIVVKDALIQSRNVPAVQLQSQLSKTSFYDFLLQANITGLKKEEFYGLALALGGSELTMLELVSLYAALANNGVLHNINSVKKQQSKKGKKILSAEASFLILDMLKDNPAPDALNVNNNYSLKNAVAWKTGTSWAFRDAWAVGVSGPYVLAVWVGNFNGKGNNAFVGRSAAGPLLFSIFDAVLPSENWQLDHLLPLKKLNLKKLSVCKKTGDLFEKHCPASVESWFIPGVSPIKVSTIYRAIPVDKTTKLRACWHQVGKTHMKVFEFWPSDFLQLFNQAGISLKTPPHYLQTCSLDQKSNSGQMPVITSPQSSVDYIVQSDNNTTQQIPFTAIVDPDVENVFWFVNTKYEGSSKRAEAFIWNASSGDFSVKVVDDSGRGASKNIRVLQRH